MEIACGQPETDKEAFTAIGQPPPARKSTPASALVIGYDKAPFCGRRQKTRVFHGAGGAVYVPSLPGRKTG